MEKRGVFCDFKFKTMDKLEASYQLFEAEGVVGI